MKIAELFVALGFEGDSKMIRTLDTLQQKTLYYSNQVTSAVKALNAMTQAARDHAYAMDLYEKTTGKSADQLQDLSYQAAQFNITQDQLASTLRNIQQISTDVRLGRGMPSAFTLLGIDPNQDPEQILAKVQQAISHLDTPTALNIASELGIDEKMFYMLKMTSKGMESLNKQYRITAAERSNLVKLNAEWQKFWFLLRQIITKFQAATADFQAKALQRFLEIANKIADMASAFMKATEASTALKVAVVTLGVALTAVFAPWLLVLGAVFLAIEDIYTYFQGGDSITGGIVDAVKEFVEFFNLSQKIKIVFETIKGTISEIVRYIKQAVEFLDNSLGGKLGAQIDILKETATGTWDRLKNILTGNTSNSTSTNRTQNNTINNTFYSNQAPDREDVSQASSDAMRQLNLVQG